MPLPARLRLSMDHLAEHARRVLAPASHRLPDQPARAHTASGGARP
ncbi:hypothetical protein M2302_006262 [Micromonospora sp. A200]|nr:hypothetical protein [Micromonospora sp. A200]